ncbi:nucleoside/nucleotide kinase family protein [Oceanomicrobium pacificus]|uniref:Thymidylate kinase n=1 Tax=Oceanomicrobium pacificus TaxID=2692916 RepID=A0A6B0TM93_9RHOB|nr:hypothetical protein [Oceanomicrobium pacificus]MXU65016.1 hypothetical protein [Oceanomicrobium pacificus]
MAWAKYIVVIGPDGSGKTSVADMLAQSLRDEGRHVARKNFSFGFMPPVSALLGRRKLKEFREGEPNSGMVKPLGRAHAMFLACWYGIDHLLGYLGPQCWRKNAVVVFARSYHDFLYQRAYLKLPPVLPRFFLALGPKPDLVATPMRDPQSIHDQKPELTATEITEQYERILQRFQRYSYFAAIDASEGTEATVKSIRQRAHL